MLLSNERTPLTYIQAGVHCNPPVFCSAVQGSDSCLGLFHPRCKSLHFLLNFMMLLLAQFSSLSRFHWIGVLPFGVPVTPLNLMSHANLLVPSARSLIKMLNNVSPTTHPDVLCSVLANNQTHSLQSLPFASGSPASFQSTNGLLVQPTFPSFQVRMPWERVTKALLN